MKQKIGQGHAAAMLRLGVHELQNAVIDPGSNVAQRHNEPGSFASPTPGEIAAERKEEKVPVGVEAGRESILDQHTREAQSQQREAAEPTAPQRQAAERGATEPERE